MDTLSRQMPSPQPRIWHSHTGCLRCRARREKCDQAKPVCGSCIRHKLPCHWRDADRNLRRSVSAAHKAGHAISKSALPTPSAVSSPSGRNFGFPSPVSIAELDYSPVVTVSHRPYTSILLRYFSNVVAPQLVPDMPVECLISMAFQDLHLYSSILALSAVAMSAASNDLRPLAMEYHTLALNATNLAVANSQLTGPDIAVIFSVLLLIEFEKMRPDTTGDPTAHIFGLIELVRWLPLIPIKIPPMRDEDSRRFLLRLCIESSMYNIPFLNLQLYKSFVERRGTSIDCKILPCLSAPRPEPPISPATVILGMPHHMFQVVTEAAILSTARFTAKSVVIQDVLELRQRAKLATEQLISAQDGDPGYFLADHQPLQVDGAFLYVAAATFVIESLLSSMQGPADPESRGDFDREGLIERCVATVERVDMSVPTGEYYVWPLLMIGPHLTLERDLDLFVTKMSQIKDGTSSAIAKWACVTLQDQS